MSHLSDWLPGQTFEPRRYQPGYIGNWSGHLPFAHDLVVALRPSLFVELGTHLGESYFGFCQAIAENNLPCTAYAVDTWEGEPHAGFYDETVYEQVDAYNKANYPHFSYLLQMLFDEALGRFSDESIDLLHIDGLHTFGAVSHDFYGWLPKVKPGGIVLLHDTAARHQDFGVWKLWEQLKKEGEAFDFLHSWGLGVYRKPGGAEPESQLLRVLFGTDQAKKEQIRRYYQLLALELERKHQTQYSRAGKPEDLSLQVYLPSAQGYAETLSYRQPIEPDTWTGLSFDLLKGIKSGVLRLDPGDLPAMVDIRGISIVSAVDGSLLWNLSGGELEALTFGGTITPIPGSEGNEARRFFSYGADPQLFLPPLDPEKFDQPLTLKIWVRLQTNLEELLPTLQKASEPVEASSVETPNDQLPQLLSEKDELQRTVAALVEQQTSAQETIKTLTEQQSVLGTQRDELQAAVDLLNGQLAATSQQLGSVTEQLASASDQLTVASQERTALEAEQEKLIAESNRQQTRIYLLEDCLEEGRQAQKKLEEVQFESQDLETLRRKQSELEDRCAGLMKERDKLQTTLDGVLRSRSWRITSPIRRVSESLSK